MKEVKFTSKLNIYKPQAHIKGVNVINSSDIRGSINSKFTKKDVSTTKSPNYRLRISENIKSYRIEK